MNIFGVLTMAGGLALFLYGMNVMGDSLAKLSGGKLEQILEKLTSKRIMAVLLGMAVTAVIQSSSATTVMVVGFVNSGIMQLSQAVGIIMGANIGTTVTSWMLSLTGISGAGWINLLKPSSFSPVLAVIGIIMTMTCKDNSKKKDIGNILLGFAILMFGMETMSGAVAPLADNEKFTGMLTLFSNPLFGLLAGTVLTAVIQSSSASVGILQALCVTGAVNYATAIPIIMGQNIGTCVTALISSVGAKKNAKRASMIHLYFNMIGTVIFMVIFYSLNMFVHFEFLSTPANAAGIAVIHSLFNIGCVIILFPFSNLLVKLATLSIPDGKHEEVIQTGVAADLAALDERFLETPAVAMELCRNTAVKMAHLSQKALDKALDIINNYSDNAYDMVFLDLELGDENGFDIAEQIVLMNNDAIIIFVTSHENLVYEAFRFRPLGYIVKDRFDREFTRMMVKIVDKLIKMRQVIELGGEKFYVDRVVSIATQKRKICVKSLKGEILLADSYSKHVAELEKYGFVQSSKGVLINMKYIKCIDEDNDVFVMYNNERVPISRRRKKDVIEEYRKFMFDNNR